ncbi:MAG: preprotein translocase subunit SecA [Candidatus Pacebacteria bacterium]|nr:preprotein translocase subunit SecA [Candidatus Paceibacterota bacterium]
MGFWDRFLQSSSSSKIKKIEPIVNKINSLEGEVGALSDAELNAKTVEFRKRLSDGATLEDILPEAFAVVREASKRTLGERHFDVQLIGGIILSRGDIAEMKTGEGKTLVATLPTYLHALSGKGVHVVTVNDYLSRRDAVWMGQIYNFLGLSVGIINQNQSFLYDPNHSRLDEERDEIGSFKVVDDFLSVCGRSEAYDADITYGTNSEFGFDYLRDNIERTEDKLRQRGFNYAIVDEIDSILIDEARTPLIISAPMSQTEDLYKIFSSIVSSFKEDEDYTKDEKHKSIELTDSGIEKAEKALGIGNIYTDKGIKYVHHLETAVRAKALFQNDVDYVIRDNQVIIIDQFTGRLQSGRRWSEGLHQAIESKEGVPVQQESRTFASVTYQNFFRMYDNLSGMTGTAETSAEEFYKVYGLDTVVIPTNRPISRKDYDDLIFQTEKGKFQALARKVKELNDKGQPVLIGTISVEKNEMLSEFLRREGISHELLNAKNNEREGEIVAQAGTKGAVTVATNMAGRGVDVKLGGNPATKEEYEEVKKLGGLFVIGTERHEARRIDNQLRGRSGRQGDPGETQFFVSMEDSLMRVFGPEKIKSMMGRLGIPEDESIQNRFITRSLESAQKKIEGFNFDARKSVLDYDDVLNFQRKTMYQRRSDVLKGDSSVVKKYVDDQIIPVADDFVVKFIENKVKESGEEMFYTSLKQPILQTMDIFWVDHLEAMDYLRSSVNLRAYGQRDPLVEYKKEGLSLFKEMEASVKQKIAEVIPHVDEITSRVEDVELKENLSKGDPSRLRSEKIGRNQRVLIEKGGVEKEVKYKKAESLIRDGWKVKAIIS